LTISESVPLLKKHCFTLVQDRINELLEKSSFLRNDIKKASFYSTLEGKKLRPLLMLFLAKALNVPFEKVLDPACSVEMVHCFSLIHDDLPCMDDDSLRRGKPTLHVVYGEDKALLTGDFLLTYAFEVLVRTKLQDLEKVHMVKLLSHYTGNRGMIAGQCLDLNSIGKKITSKTLIKMHYYKTACLLQCSFEMVAVLAKASPTTYRLLKKLGAYLGIAYQIKDDILDITSPLPVLGKDPFSDENKKKPTAVSIWGLKKAKTQLVFFHQSMQEILKKLSLKDTEFASLLEEIFQRNH